jgi:hypothetical protein
MDIIKFYISKNHTSDNLLNVQIQPPAEMSFSTDW